MVELVIILHSPASEQGLCRFCSVKRNVPKDVHGSKCEGKSPNCIPSGKVRLTTAACRWTCNYCMIVTGLLWALGALQTLKISNNELKGKKEKMGQHKDASLDSLLISHFLCQQIVHTTVSSCSLPASQSPRPCFTSGVFPSILYHSWSCGSIDDGDVGSAMANADRKISGEMRGEFEYALLQPEYILCFTSSSFRLQWCGVSLNDQIFPSPSIGRRWIDLTIVWLSFCQLRGTQSRYQGGASQALLYSDCGKSVGRW